jgi:hypothetical protein
MNGSYSPHSLLGFSRLFANAKAGGFVYATALASRLTGRAVWTVKEGRCVCEYFVTDPVILQGKTFVFIGFRLAPVEKQDREPVPGHSSLSASQDQPAPLKPAASALSH